MTVKVCNSALEAISVIQDNEFIWTHSMAATPRVLFEALATHAKSRQNLTLMQLHTERSDMLASEDIVGHLRHRCFFSSTSTRPLLAKGLADYVPVFLSEVPKLFRSGEQVIDSGEHNGSGAAIQDYKKVLARIV